MPHSSYLRESGQGIHPLIIDEHEDGGTAMPERQLEIFFDIKLLSPSHTRSIVLVRIRLEDPRQRKISRGSQDFNLEDPGTSDY
jgi:hypothetical protein